MKSTRKNANAIGYHQRYPRSLYFSQTQGGLPDPKRSADLQKEVRRTRNRDRTDPKGGVRPRFWVLRTQKRGVRPRFWVLGTPKRGVRPRFRGVRTRIWMSRTRFWMVPTRFWTENDVRDPDFVEKMGGPSVLGFWRKVKKPIFMAQNRL